MSVSNVQVVPASDGWNYPELPRGMFVWFGQGQTTGDGTGGGIGFAIRFNPDTNRTFQSYVAIKRLSIRAAVVPQTGSLAIVSGGSNWDYTDQAVIPIGIAPFVVTISAAGSDAVYDGWKYLGRPATGQSAEIAVNMVNVDTAVLDMQVMGVMCDRPFIPNDLWGI